MRELRRLAWTVIFLVLEGKWLIKGGNVTAVYKAIQKGVPAIVVWLRGELSVDTVPFGTMSNPKPYVPSSTGYPFIIMIFYLGTAEAFIRIYKRCLCALSSELLFFSSLCLVFSYIAANMIIV